MDRFETLWCFCNVERPPGQSGRPAWTVGLARRHESFGLARRNESFGQARRNESFGLAVEAQANATRL